MGFTSRMQSVWWLQMGNDRGYCIATKRWAITSTRLIVLTTYIRRNFHSPTHPPSDQQHLIFTPWPRYPVLLDESSSTVAPRLSLCVPLIDRQNFRCGGEGSGGRPTLEWPEGKGHSQGLPPTFRAWSSHSSGETSMGKASSNDVLCAFRARLSRSLVSAPRRLAARAAEISRNHMPSWCIAASLPGRGYRSRYSWDTYRL